MIKCLPLSKIFTTRRLFATTRSVQLLLVLFLTATSGFAQVYPTYLVADINKGSTSAFVDSIENTVVANNLLFFYNANTRSVWRSDGTMNGTYALLYASGAYPAVGSIVSIGNKVIFAATSSEFGYEPYISDGTFEGTHRIADLTPGPADSRIIWLKGGNGIAYFSNLTTTHGVELWRTDGTAAGTFMLKDILRGTGGSQPSELTIVGNTAYFSANDGAIGYELWKTDGTVAGTVLVKDVRTGERLSSTPKNMANVNGTLFFTAYDATHGRELWKSNGTAAGTVLVKDIRPGSAESLPDNLTGVGSTLYFGANNGTNGRELWKSDGTAAGTVLLKDVQPGSASYAGGGYPHLSNFTPFNGKLYFVTYTDRPRVWTSDGTTAGTVPISPLDKHITGIDLNLTVFKNALYYVTNANSGEPRYMQLWKTDGTMAGHQLVHGELGLSPNKDMQLTAGTERMYFTTMFAYSTPFKNLWSTDGTTAGTQRVEGVTDYYTNSYPSHLTTSNGKVYFEAYDGEHYGLYTTQGSQSNTVLLRQFPDSFLSDFYASGNFVYFIVEPSNPDNAIKSLWRTDGTTAGTIKLMGLTSIDFPRNFNYETVENGNVFITYEKSMWKTGGTPETTLHLKTFPQYIYWMANAGAELLFAADDGVKGLELWKSDGTVAGTVLMRDIWPGSNHALSANGFYREGDAFKDPAVTINGVAYFLANAGGDANWELWRSDGTLSGTRMLKNDETGRPFSPYNALTVANNQIFLFTYEENQDEGLPDVWELWKSDGTTAGTTKIITVPLDPWWLEPTAVMIGGPDKFYFVPWQYQEAHNLWVSDGTAAGTKIIKELGNKEGPWPVHSAFIGNHLFLSFGNDYDKMLIRSDGTTCGTFHINFGGDPDERYEQIYLATLGNTLFVPGFGDPEGKELRAYDDVNDPCGAAVAEAMMVEESPTSAAQIRSYPNPFVDEFTIQMDGAEGEVYEVEVRSLEGQLMMEPTLLNANEVHRMGQQWRKGIYMIKIRSRDTVTTERLIKN
jgi:trimeric autotransporter adhesin